MPIIPVQKNITDDQVTKPTGDVVGIEITEEFRQKANEFLGAEVFEETDVGQHLVDTKGSYTGTCSELENKKDNIIGVAYKDKAAGLEKIISTNSNIGLVRFNISLTNSLGGCANTNAWQSKEIDGDKALLFIAATFGIEALNPATITELKPELVMQAIDTFKPVIKEVMADPGKGVVPRPPQ